MTDSELNSIIRKFWIPLSLLALFAAAVAFRPLLPIDETRYTSAAWEMYLRGDWLAPLTVNFQPYHHKPPFLFWLINASWAIFGVSRWAATIPVVLMAGASIYLTRNLARKLFPESASQTQIIPLLMTGSIPFLIYSTLVMFDLTLTVFVLLTLIALVSFARTGKIHLIVLMALAMGLGVLTKGPVAWLHVVFPMLLGPLWTGQKQPLLKWYGGCLAALLLSVLPVLAWLIPVLQASSNDFAFWLIWEQTAGRVTGNFSDAHIRPFYFYLPMIPILFMPWMLFPSFWKSAKAMRRHITDDSGLRFILCWIIPVFLSFSLISGKQPHYMVPILPGIIIITTLMIKTDARRIALTSFLLIALIFCGQAVASMSVFKNYDLQPVVDYIRAHPGHDWAYARKYHGEVTFLARMEKTVDIEQLNTLPAWFAAHPDGLAMISYSNPRQVKDFKMVFDMPYRGKKMGVFSGEK